MANDNRALAGLESIQDHVLRGVLKNLHERVLGLQTTGASGTLNPDQKPRLAQRDAGTTFYAVDFNRSYTWSGTAWADSAGQPPRGQTADFHTDPSPVAGWVRCNGNQAYRSTRTGGVELFYTPSIPMTNGLTRWMRV